MIRILSIVVIFLFISCEKPEGTGGNAVIKGKIYVEDYNQEGQLKDEYYPGEWPVYIIYGNEPRYGDSEDTHFDGSFAFEYLYPGNYTIYTYSKCKSCPGEREIISIKVELENREIEDIGDIIVRD